MWINLRTLWLTKVMKQEYDFDWLARGGMRGEVQPIRPRSTATGRALREILGALHEPLPGEWDRLLKLIDEADLPRA